MTQSVKTVVSDVEKAAGAAASGVEASAKAAVEAQVTKQESWIKRNWKALAIGLVLGFIVKALL